MSTINIKATNMELTSAIEGYVQEKLSADNIGRFAGTPITHIDVEVGKISQHHNSGDVFRAEITVSLAGRVERAEIEAGDLYAAIDMVRDEIIEVLRSRKTKKDALWRRGARKIKKLLRFE